jgi:hypothetical protein
MMPLLTVGPMIASGTLVDLSPQTRIIVTLNWYSTMHSSHLLSALSDIVEGQAKEWLISAS